MKIDLPATSAKIKNFGPLYLIDNEMMTGAVLSLPWPFRGVQIQIIKVRGNEQ
ncbi:hypothetical protein [Marinomonas posidonica]|uniref:hypothetical protein n=1 Tax=Marinomonas posidonica TaxID=936476 RepID=UPI0037359087